MKKLEILRNWQNGESDTDHNMTISDGKLICHLCLFSDGDGCLKAVIAQDEGGEPGKVDLSPDLFLENYTTVPDKAVPKGKELATEYAFNWLKNYDNQSKEKQ